MELAFQQHFDTNYTPSIEETTQIKDLLRDSAEELQRIDVEIILLQQQRSILHELAEKHRALISPVRRMDRDILEQIFLACLPVDRNPCMSSTEAPVLLTHICSSWRRIAHTTPRLWAAIHIAFHWDYSAPSREPRMDSEHAAIIRSAVTQREAAAKAWLDRSGNLPLSISIFQRLKYRDIRLFPDGPKFVTEFHEQYGTFIRSIRSYCERWKTLDVHLPCTALELLLEGGSIFERLKMLVNLHITAYDNRNGRNTSSEPEMLWLWPAVSGFVSSQITSATIFGVYSTDIGKFHPWTHLTELNFEADMCHVESNAAIFIHTGRIISHCRMLKMLKLTIIPRVATNSDISSNNIQSQEYEPIVLNHLEELSLSLPPSKEAIRFVHRLSLPAIRQLDFMFSGEQYRSYELAKDAITSILHNCEGGITLSLYCPDWLSSSEELLGLLRLMPYVNHFKIAMTELCLNRWTTFPASSSYYGKHITDDLLSILSSIGKGSPDVICPNLEALEFDTIFPTKVTRRGLRAFIQARKRAHLNHPEHVAFLRKLRIYINDYTSPDQQMEEKVSHDMDCVIYFKEREHFRVSPFDGFNEKNVLDTPYYQSEMCTEL